MKRLLLILLLLPSLAWGSDLGQDYARMNPYILGGGVSAAAEPGCVAGTTFSYNGDHSSGATYACDSAGAALSGTLSDPAPTVTTSSVTYNAVNTYIRWAVDSSEVNGSTTGTVYFTYVVPDPRTDNDLVQLVNSGGDYRIYIYVNGGYLEARHNANGTHGYYEARSPSLTAGSTYRIGYTWDVPNDKTCISTVTPVGAESWREEDTDDMTTFASAINQVTIGEDISGFANVAQTNIISDLVILSGYKAADPLNP